MTDYNMIYRLLVLFFVFLFLFCIMLWLSLVFIDIVYFSHLIPVRKERKKKKKRAGSAGRFRSSHPGSGLSQRCLTPLIGGEAAYPLCHGGRDPTTSASAGVV